MTLQDIVTRLRSQCPALISVEIAYDMNEIASPELDTPAAFVLELEHQADPNTGMGALVSQRCAISFGVIIVARSATDIAEPLKVARQEVRAALIGWQPDETAQVTFSGGKHVAVEAGLARWLDTFTYDEYQRYVR